MQSFLIALARGVFLLLALLKIMVTCRNQSLSVFFKNWIKEVAERNPRSKGHPQGPACALVVLPAGTRWSAWRSSQLRSPVHPVVSISSGNKWLICIYKLLLFIGCFIGPHSFLHILQAVKKPCSLFHGNAAFMEAESAPENIRLLNSVFRPLLTAAFQRFSSTAHSHPSERPVTGAAKEREAQATPVGAGITRAEPRLAVATLLGGTLGLSLAFDFLWPLGGIKNALVGISAFLKNYQVLGRTTVKGDS